MTKVKLQNTKINKKSFRFLVILIIGWDLNSPFVSYLCTKRWDTFNSV